MRIKIKFDKGICTPASFNRRQLVALIEENTETITVPDSETDKLQAPREDIAVLVHSVKNLSKTEIIQNLVSAAPNASSVNANNVTSSGSIEHSLCNVNNRNHVTSDMFPHIRNVTPAQRQTINEGCRVDLHMWLKYLNEWYGVFVFVDIPPVVLNLSVDSADQKAI